MNDNVTFESLSQDFLIRYQQFLTAHNLGMEVKILKSLDLGRYYFETKGLIPIYPEQGGLVYIETGAEMQIRVIQGNYAHAFSWASIGGEELTESDQEALEYFGMTWMLSASELHDLIKKNSPWKLLH